MVGGATGRHKGGRHLKYPDHTPMTNLILSVLDKVGVPMDTLGDSTGALVGASVPERKSKAKPKGRQMEEAQTI